MTPSAASRSAMRDPENGRATNPSMDSYNAAIGTTRFGWYSRETMSSAQAPLTFAQTVPTESALQLPFDFQRTPSTLARLACHEFQLESPAAGAPTDAQLAAAFGVLLFRYGFQSEIRLDALRSSAAGETRWRQTLTISTPADASCRNVWEQADDFLRRETSDRHPVGGGAAIFLAQAAASRAPIART